MQSLGFCISDQLNWLIHFANIDKGKVDITVQKTNAKALDKNQTKHSMKTLLEEAHVLLKNSVDQKWLPQKEIQWTKYKLCKFKHCKCYKQVTFSEMIQLVIKWANNGAINDIKQI